MNEFKILVVYFVLTVSLLNLEGVDGAVMDIGDSSVSSRGIDAKSIITSIATNFLSRGFYPTAAAGSQVVSLNLTNLLVLVLLKALIFAAGSIGLGHLKEKEYGYYGRSLDNKVQPENHNLVLTEDEILLYLGYLTGNRRCVQNIACLQPEHAKKYAEAGEILLRTTKLFSIETDVNYGNILREVEEAAEVGRNNGDCSVFMCDYNDYT